MIGSGRRRGGGRDIKMFFGMSRQEGVGFLEELLNFFNQGKSWVKLKNTCFPFKMAKDDSSFFESP